MIRQQIIIYIFTRDLRTHDNIALLEAVQAAKTEKKKLLPLFVLTPEQIDRSRNRYFSDRAVQFMVESLVELQSSLKGCLNVIKGTYTDALEEIQEKMGDISKIYISYDCTPYAKARALQLEEWVQAERSRTHRDIAAHIIKDNHSLLPQEGRMYQVFTAFYRANHTADIPRPKRVHIPQSLCICMKDRRLDLSTLLGTIHQYHPHHPRHPHVPHVTMRGGRKAGLAKIQKGVLETKRGYDRDRDLPSKDGTTRISAYLKFGCISPREAYWAIADSLGRDHGIVRELFWRDFYARIVDRRPDLLDDVDLHIRQRLQWNASDADFQRWCDGRTGFPFIDAGMRQLNTTGWMHNRLRMCVAMFLAKDLFIDWRKGLRFFSQKLVDIDFASNWGGWVWSAIGFADSQPFTRIFNPWEQGRRYDPDCIYITQWVPELRNLTAREIHGWEREETRHTVRARLGDAFPGYPDPMVDHRQAYNRAKVIYKKGRS